MSDTLFENYTEGENNNADVYSTYYSGQQFTTTSAHSITSIKARLTRNSATPGTITVGIYTVDGDGYPDTLLCSGTTDGNTLPEYETVELREITLGEGADLENATQYVIVIYGASTYVYWKMRTDGEYTGGNMVVSTDSGSSWSDYAARDAMFEVYGIASGPTAYTLTTENTAITIGNKDSILKYGRKLITSVAQVILAGIDAIITRTGIQWYNQSKSTAISPTNVSKDNISPTNLTKNSISTTNLTKNSISPTNTTKNSISPTNQAKS